VKASRAIADGIIESICRRRPAPMLLAELDSR
jgi:hypothetical protein